MRVTSASTNPAPIESLCLFDADTIDANIGMPSFVRNIYIHLHLHDVRREPGAPTVANILQNDPLDYLRPYVTDRLPAWIAGKQRDFIPRLRTQTGRALALGRLTRLERLFEQLERELDGPEEDGEKGCLAAMMHFMNKTDDPSIAGETAYLSDGWLQGSTSQARWFIEHLLAESAGRE